MHEGLVGQIHIILHCAVAALKGSTLRLQYHSLTSNRDARSSSQSQSLNALCTESCSGPGNAAAAAAAVRRNETHRYWLV